MEKVFRRLDKMIIRVAQRWYMPLSRAAFFIIFFYFGALKLLGMSPANPLAAALTERTIGLQYLDEAFIILATIECLIGVLFLVPKATRSVIALLFIHLAVVCSPLMLTPDYIWTAPFVPNLEGQYIIKNIALVAIAIVIAAHVSPLDKIKKKS